MIPPSTVDMDYQIIHLGPGEPYSTDSAALQATGLLQPGPDGSVVIFTGVMGGWVRVEVSGELPASPDDWEESASLDGVVITEEWWLGSPTAEGYPDPVFTPEVPGTHNVTVFARNRTLNPGAFLEEDDPELEEYLVVIQPS